MKRHTKIHLKAIVLLAGIFCLSISAGATKHTYVYDTSGNLTQVQMSQGVTLSYQYDQAGNCIQKKVDVPCFDWGTLMSHVAQWPTTNVTVKTLISDMDCTKINKKGT